MSCTSAYFENEQSPHDFRYRLVLKEKLSPMS